MARFAAKIWKMVHDLHAISALGRQRCFDGHFHETFAKKADFMSHFATRQHRRSMPPSRRWSAEKKGEQAIGRSKGGLTTKIHMLASGPDSGLFFTLTPGQKSDCKSGESLLQELNFRIRKNALLLMDKAYEGMPMRNAATAKNLIPVVPPRAKRLHPWKYDARAYALRNQVERLFHRLKNFRRIATRYDKLDTSFAALIALALVFLFLKFM